MAPRLNVWLLYTPDLLLHEFFLTHSPVPFTNSCHICRVICTEVPLKYTFQECILARQQPYRSTICWLFNSGMSYEDSRASTASGLQAFSFENLWPGIGYKENPQKFLQNYSALPKMNLNDPQKLNQGSANTKKQKYKVPLLATSQHRSYRPLISD